MKTYRVVETVTTDYIYYIDANSKSEAVKEAKQTSTYDSADKIAYWDGAKYKVEEYA
jgi:hypothetical protein